MRTEKSCGIVPFYRKNNELYVVLVKQNNGVVGFPKGHVENNETEKETAFRECLEETKLKPTIIGGFREEISYFMKEYNANKIVVFFVGIIESLDFEKQVSEISEIFLCKVEEALQKINHEDTREVLRKAVAFLIK